MNILIENNKLVVIFLFVLILLVWLTPLIIKWIKQKRHSRLMIRSGIKDIDKMNGYEFEEYLKALFKKLGYRPRVTKKSGDFGADLILVGKNKIVVQAKRYGYMHKVSLDAIREVYASQAYYSANEAWVITNSVFTKQARELAKACNVKLLDRLELQKFILKVNPDQRASEFITRSLKK